MVFENPFLADAKFQPDPVRGGLSRVDDRPLNPSRFPLITHHIYRIIFCRVTNKRVLVTRIFARRESKRGVLAIRYTHTHTEVCGYSRRVDVYNDEYRDVTVTTVTFAQQTRTRRQSWTTTFGKSWWKLNRFHKRNLAGEKTSRRWHPSDCILFRKKIKKNSPSPAYGRRRVISPGEFVENRLVFFYRPRGYPLFDTRRKNIRYSRQIRKKERRDLKNVTLCYNNYPRFTYCNRTYIRVERAFLSVYLKKKKKMPMKRKTKKKKKRF